MGVSQNREPKKKTSGFLLASLWNNHQGTLKNKHTHMASGESFKAVVSTRPGASPSILGGLECDLRPHKVLPDGSGFRAQHRGNQRASG